MSERCSNHTGTWSSTRDLGARSKLGKRSRSPASCRNWLCDPNSTKSIFEHRPARSLTGGRSTRSTRFPSPLRTSCVARSLPRWSDRRSALIRPRCSTTSCRPCPPRERPESRCTTRSPGAISTPGWTALPTCSLPAASASKTWWRIWWGCRWWPAGCPTPTASDGSAPRSPGLAGSRPSVF